jgi:transposase InsO family protein
MTESGDPRENAIAERLNGILKVEWLNDMKLKSIEDVILEVTRIIDIYNNKRLHSSLDMKTPSEAHILSGELKKRWKPRYKNNKDTTSCEVFLGIDSSKLSKNKDS